MYSNLRMYINPKGMISMLVTGHYVWNHAYGHDKVLTLGMPNSSSVTNIGICVMPFNFALSRHLFWEHPTS
jgi:hypothetical protein